MRSAILRITLKRSKEFRIRRSGSNCGCKVGREDIDIIETVDLFHNNDTKTELASCAHSKEPLRKFLVETEAVTDEQRAQMLRFW